MHKFPFRRRELIQHVSGNGPVFIVRAVDDEAWEASAERTTADPGAPPVVRVINPGNWKKVEEGN